MPYTEVAASLVCSYTCAPCSQRSCVTGHGALPPDGDWCEFCEAYLYLTEEPEARVLPRQTESASSIVRGAPVVAIKGPVTAAAVEQAVDGLDKILEDIYCGRKHFGVQELVEIVNYMETIRAGERGGGKK